MIRTQIQLPNELHRRAKRFGAHREMSLAEVTRRGLELLLDRYPGEASEDPPARSWRLPRVDGGGIKVPLARLRDVATGDEELRGRRPR